nr:MerR family transcriptional regulator [Nocardia carnea]
MHIRSAGAKRPQGGRYDTAAAVKKKRAGGDRDSPRGLARLDIPRPGAAGTDPASAKTILRAVHNGDRRRVFALLDTAHARLDRERRDLHAARTAARAIADEPLTDIRPTDAMSISELARALGVRPSTLRYWDATGLVVPRRAEIRETRVYSPDDVRAARLVHQLRLAGYGIEPLRQLIPELRGRHHWNDLAAALTARDARIDSRSAALLDGAAALSALLGLPATE